MIEQLLAQWQRCGVRLNAGASEGDLQWLERYVGAALPEDVRRFYSLADGMPDTEVDEHLVSFWSIAKIRQEVSGHAWPGHQTPIADVLINSWFICLEVLQGGRVSIGLEVQALEFASFTSFFERYVSDPSSLGFVAESGRRTSG